MSAQANAHSTTQIDGVGFHAGPLHGKPAKLMALDVGQARIGVAVCDPLQLAPRPLTTLTRSSRRADFAKLAQLVRQEEIAAIVCGLPLNMDGSEGPQAATTRKWALRLAQALRTLLGHPLPILFWDERLSTYTAQSIMQNRQAPQKGHPGEDAIAAAVILQSYLEHLADRTTTIAPDSASGSLPGSESDAGTGPTYDSIVLPRAGHEVPAQAVSRPFRHQD